MLSTKKLIYKILELLHDTETYTGSNGLQISRVGRVATIDSFPSVTTTASSTVIGNITDSAFLPNAAVEIATRVYNGSTYVDCNLMITATGSIQLRSPSNAVVAGYQGQWCKLKGLTYICMGG